MSCGPRCGKDLGNASLKRDLNITRNAIVSLSPNTYSCAGEGDRFGGGGVASLACDTGLKYRLMPVGFDIIFSMASSSVVGADDKEESESAMVEGRLTWRLRQKCESKVQSRVKEGVKMKELDFRGWTGERSELNTPTWQRDRLAFPGLICLPS